MPKTAEMKINEGREYRDIDLGGLKFRAEDDGEMIVEGYATTFNSPYELFRDGTYTFLEQIDARAFDECDLRDVIMQYNHEGRVFARTSNGTLTVTPDRSGLLTRGRLGGTELGRQIFAEIRGGYTTKMSFGFRVGEVGQEITEDRETGRTTVLRTITKISRLYDVSAVSLPANDATSISARSLCDGLIAELTQERRAREERERQKQKIRILTTIGG